MSEHFCKKEEVFEKVLDRLRSLEADQIEYKTELKIYIRQMNEIIADIRSSVDGLTNKQYREAEIKEIVRNVLYELKSSIEIEDEEYKKSKLYLIVIELIKLIGLAIAIIGGIKLIE